MGKLTPIERLKKRIEKEFDSKALLGDIQISDEEYALLLDFLKRVYIKASTSYHCSFDGKVFVVAIIQIAIRKYDGKMWPHICNEINVNYNAKLRNFITSSFINTLNRYRKTDKNNDEFVHNILMQIFVSDPFINRLFGFIYSYYQIDLERNLTLNTKEIMNALINNIIDKDARPIDSDFSSRDYLLNKHTIDAIRVNTRSAKMKIRWILKLIDRAFWDKQLPNNPKSRLSRLFVQWVEVSDVFKDDVNQYSNKEYKSKKQFRTPILHYNFKREAFSIYIPGQTLTIREIRNIVYTLVIDGFKQKWSPECVQSRAGYKISEEEIGISLSEIFKEITLFINVNGEEVRKFNITQSSSYVKFDNTGYQLNRLRMGELIIFAKKNMLPQHSSIRKQPMVGYYEMAFYNIEEDDYIIVPDGKNEFVEVSHANRLSNKGIVKYASHENLAVYNMIPPFFFSIRKERFDGSRVKINGTWKRLNELKTQAIEVANDDGKDSDFVLEIDETQGVTIGVNEVTFDIPNDYKIRNYTFSYLPKMMFDLVESPYIFDESAVIEFNSSVTIDAEYTKKGINTYVVDISDDTNRLKFDYVTKSSKFEFHVDLPVVRWGFSENKLTHRNMGDYWVGDFKFKIYVDTPVDFKLEVSLEDDYQHIDVNKPKNQGLIECDLTRMRSWLTGEKTYYDIFIVTESSRFKFGRIFTQTKVTSMQPLHWNEDDMTINGQISIIGKDPIYISITHNPSGKIIIDKAVLKDESFSFPCEGFNGDYKVEIYKKTRGFGGTGYEVIFEKDSRIITDNLSGLNFYIRSHRFQEQKIFLEYYNYRYLINDFMKVSKGIYVGKLFEKPLERSIFSRDIVNEFVFISDIEVRFIREKDYSVAEILVLEDEENDSFLYDVKQKRLVLTEDYKLESRQRYTRYKPLFDQMTIFELELK